MQRSGIRSAKRRAAIGLTLAFSVLAAACGSSAAPAAKPAPASSPSTASPPASSPAKPKPLFHVKMATGTLAMNDTPVFVAKAGGFFRKNGLALQLITFGTAAPQLEAVQSGSVQVINSGTINFLRGINKGIKLLAVAEYTKGITTSLTLRDAVLKKRGVTANSPLKQRLAALKGLTLGVEALGGVVDGLTRYLIREAGLTPGKDVKLVSIGGPGSLLAAMQHGQIDGFLSSPPWPQDSVARGFGTIVVSGPKGDIKGYDAAINNEIAVAPSFARAHPAVVRAIVRSIAEANAYIAAHPKKAATLLETAFRKVPAPVVAASLRELMPAFPTDVHMSARAWSEANRLWQQAGILKRPVPTPQGSVWTNRYIAQ